MSKQNDLVLNILANPHMTIEDFLKVGYSAENTSLEDESAYLNSKAITENPMFLNLNGDFDEVKFHNFYLIAAKGMNLINSSPQDFEAVYSKYNIFAPQNQRDMKPSFELVEAPNPDRITRSMLSVGIAGPREYTPAEIAQSQKVYNSETGEWMDTPEDMFSFGKLFRDFGGFFKDNFESSKVLATYDFDEDINGKKRGDFGFDENNIAHHKGEYKLNDNGTYYYRTLKEGENIYGKQLLHYSDILTREGSALNAIDFLDSDDIRKSPFGSFVKDASLIGAMFLPGGVGTAIAGATIFLQAAGLGATLGKIAFGSDSATMNWIEGLAKSTNFMETRSEWSQFDYAGTGRNANWTVENLLGMAGDVVGQLYQQRLLFKHLPRIVKGKWGVSEENLKLLEKQILSDLEKESSTKLSNFAKGTAAYEKARAELSAANQIAAARKVEEYMKEYYHLGEELSKAYMTMLTVNDIYGEAKEAMGSDFDAAVVTMGYAAMEYALLSTDIGKWVLPELRGDRLQNKALLRAVTKDIRESFAKLGKEAATNEQAKRTYLLRLLDFGKNVYKGEFATGLGKRASLEGGSGLLKAGAGSLFAGALAEGVEETTEELLADISKVLYNGLLKLEGKDNYMTPFEGMTDRYALSFLGGFVGGGVSSAAFDFSDARRNLNMDFNLARQQLIWKVRNNDLDGIYKILDEDTVGNKNLSAFKYDLNEKGERIWKSAESETDSLDYQIKQTVRRWLLMTLDTMNAHGGNLSDESLLDVQTLRDLRFRALQNSTTSGLYIQKYNQLISELVAKVLELDAKRGELKDSDKKDDINPEKLKAILKIEEEISLLDKEIENYTSGKLAPLYMTSALLESTPYILKPLMAGSFRDYVELKRHTEFEKVPQKDLEELLKSYLEYLRTEKKDDLELATRSYLGLQKMIKANLEEAINVIRAQETDPEIQALLEDYSEKLSAINSIDLEDEAWIEKLSDIASKSLIGGSIITQQIQLLKNSHTELNEKFEKDFNEFAKALNEELENVEKQNKEALEKGLIDEETYENSRLKLILEKEQKLKDFEESGKKQINEFFEKKRNEIIIEGLLKQASQLIDKLLKLGYINGAIKDRVFAGLENVLHAVELYSKSIEMSPNDEYNLARQEEYLRDGIINSIEELGESAVTEQRLKEIEYDKTVLKPAIEEFKSKLKQVKELKYTPILLNLDKFALSINGGNISGLLTTLGNVLHSNASNIQSFNMTGELYKQLVEAERIIQLYVAALEGARTDNVDPFRVLITKGFKAEDTSNVWGINKVLNEVHSKAPKLENDPWEDLPEISGNDANMLLMDAKSILEVLLTYKKLYTLNQGLKLNVQQRVATKTTFLLYRRVKDLLSHVEFLDDKYKAAALAVLKDLNKLEELSKDDNPENWNLDLSEQEIELIEKERLQMEDGLHKFFNETGLIDDEEALEKMFRDSFTLNDSSQNQLSETSTSLNDSAFIGYLASKAAIKSTNFYGKFKETLDGKKAPLISQEIHIGLTVANVLNGPVVTKIIQAYRNAIIDKFTNLSYEQRVEYLVNSGMGKDAAYIASTDAMLPLFINNDLVPQYDNITFIEGIAGSGKTGGVINMSTKFLASYPDVTKKAWIIHGGDSENSTKYGELLKTDLELTDGTVYNRKGFLSKLSSDYTSPEYKNGYYEYSEDSYLITEEGRIIPKWNLNNDDDVPSIIIIDEALQFTQLELLLIDKYAKLHGIPIIISGDLSQSLTSAKFKMSLKYRDAINDELKERNIKRSNSEELLKIRDDLELTLSLARNLVLHAPKLGSSMRTENNLKNQNMIATQVISSNGKGNLELHYYEDETTLAGDMVISNSIDLQHIIEDYVKKIIAIGGRINFVSYSKNTPLVQTLLKNYGEHIDFEEGIALGLEGDYWLIELDSKKNGTPGYMLDFYTGLTRGRKFTILVSDMEVKTTPSDPNKKITFSNIQDSETHPEEYNRDAIKKYAERRKNLLNKIITNPENIDLLPRESVKKTETIIREPLKKPYKKPTTVVDLNKSIYKPGTLIEIYTSEGLKQEDAIYEIKDIRETRHGLKINLENIKTKARVTLNYDDVVNNIDKYKVVDDVEETVVPETVPFVDDATEPEEEAEASISEVTEEFSTEEEVKKDVLEKIVEDNEEEDKDIHSVSGKSVEDFDIYLFSNATYETGVEKVDPAANTFEFSKIEERIDGLNGFRRLLDVTSKDDIKDIAEKLKYYEGLAYIGILRRILLTIDSKKTLEDLIETVLGLPDFSSYIRYAVKTSELNDGGLEGDSKRFGKLEKGNEKLPYKTALNIGDSTTAQNRTLVAIIGTEADGDIIEIPLLILNNPRTLILSSIYKDTPVRDTYLTKAREGKRPGDKDDVVKGFKAVLENFRDSEPGLCNLIDIYLDNSRHINFIHDKEWVPALDLYSCGPELNIERGKLNREGNEDYILDTPWISLNNLRKLEDLVVSDVMRYDRKDGCITTDDGRKVKIVSNPKHPFVLYTDLYHTHTGERLTRDNILEEYIYCKSNGLNHIKLVYILPPKFTLDEYINSLIEFTVHNSKENPKERPLGNQRTAYKILEALVKTDPVEFEKICVNAFGEDRGKLISLKIINFVKEMSKLSVSLQIKRLTKDTEAWHLGGFGIPSLVQLYRQLLNILKLLVHPAGIQIVQNEDGSVFGLKYSLRGTSKLDEQMDLIRPLFEASGTVLYYQTVGDTAKSWNDFTPIKTTVDEEGNIYIGDSRISDKEFHVKGNLSPSTFRTKKSFNKILEKIGKESREFNESGKNIHSNADTFAYSSNEDEKRKYGYSGFSSTHRGVSVPREASLHPNIVNKLNNVGLTTSIKPGTFEDNSPELKQALIDEINARKDGHKAIMLPSGELFISKIELQFNGTDVVFNPNLTIDLFNGQYYEFEMLIDGKQHTAVFDENNGELWVKKDNPVSNNPDDYDFTSWYDDVTPEHVQNNLKRFKELGDKILKANEDFEKFIELLEAINSNNALALADIFNEDVTHELISNPDYKGNFDLINYVDILKFDKVSENLNENSSCEITFKIKFY